MATVSHNIEYALTLLGSKLASSLSPRMADKFGSGLGSLAHALVKSRRQVARENLRLGLGETLSEDEIDTVTKQVFRSIGRTFIELARFGVTTLADVNRLVVGTIPDALNEALDRGNGALIATAHFGNWEMMGTWFAANGFPIDFLVGVQHNQKVDELLTRLRRNMGVGIISSKTGLRGVLKSLRANRLVGLAADQHIGTGLVLDFFGRKATFAKGPAAFAVKADSTILPFVLKRERYDRHVVLPGPVQRPQRDRDKEEEIVRITTELARFFEEQIRRNPDQWMWTHRRWKL